jgi:hypothetical protein
MQSPDNEDASHTSWTQPEMWLWAIVIVGVALRVVQWLHGQSIWHDEAFLLLNLRQYDLARLLTGRLDADPSTQAGAPAFIALCKATWEVVGLNERLLRLPMLLASIATLAWLARSSVKLIGPLAAIVAVLFVVSSDKHVEQAATFKSYSVDALCSAIVIAMAMRITRDGPARSIVPTSLVAASLLWLSFTVAFVYAAASLGALTTLGRDRRRWIAWCVAQWIFAASFAVLYVVCIRVQHDDYLSRFWTRVGVFPVNLSPVQWLVWTARTLQDAWTYPWPAWTWGVPVLMVLGAWGCAAKRRWDWLVLLAMPIVLATIASAVHVYPARDRLTLFVLPATAILIGIGVDAAWRLRRSALKVIAIGIASLTAGVACGDALVKAFRPNFTFDLRPAIERVAPGTTVVAVSSDDAATIRLYAPQLRVDAFDFRSGQTVPETTDEITIVTSLNRKPDGSWEIPFGPPLDRRGYTLDVDRSFFRQGGGVLVYRR